MGHLMKNDASTHLLKRDGHLQDKDDEECCCGDVGCCENIMTGEPPEYPATLTLTFSGCGHCLDGVEITLLRDPGAPCDPETSIECSSFTVRYCASNEPLCCSGINELYFALCCEQTWHLSWRIPAVSNPDTCFKEELGLFPVSASCDPFELVFESSIPPSVMGGTCGCECPDLVMTVTL